ncbi:MAG: hypothetical protein ABIR57_07800, partial [Aeromicrobium sp.]
DSDVPQFSTVWFLPVAALGLCIAAALLDDLLPGRWTPTAAGVAYMVIRVLTVLLLATLGFSLTVIPPVAIALLMVGVFASRPLGFRLVTLGVISPLIWWPFLRIQASVTTVVPLSQLPAAVMLGAGAGLLVAIAHGDIRAPRLPGTLVKTTVMVAIVAASIGGTSERVWAHDPGQGEHVREGQLTVDRHGVQATVAATFSSPCGELRAVRTVARRAGQTLTGTLYKDKSTTCEFAGSIKGLNAGRWFVYAEMRVADGRHLEMWLPVKEGERATADRSLYAAPGSTSNTTKNLAGGSLLIVVVALFVTCLRLGRRAGATAVA